MIRKVANWQLSSLTAPQIFIASKLHGVHIAYVHPLLKHPVKPVYQELAVNLTDYKYFMFKLTIMVLYFNQLIKGKYLQK